MEGSFKGSTTYEADARARAGCLVRSPKPAKFGPIDSLPGPAPMRAPGNGRGSHAYRTLGQGVTCSR